MSAHRIPRNPDGSVDMWVGHDRWRLVKDARSDCVNSWWALAPGNPDERDLSDEDMGFTTFEEAIAATDRVARGGSR